MIVRIFSSCCVVLLSRRALLDRSRWLWIFGDLCSRTSPAPYQFREYTCTVGILVSMRDGTSLSRLCLAVVAGSYGRLLGRLPRRMVIRRVVACGHRSRQVFSTNDGKHTPNPSPSFDGELCAGVLGVLGRPKSSESSALICESISDGLSLAPGSIPAGLPDRCCNPLIASSPVRFLPVL